MCPRVSHALLALPLAALAAAAVEVDVAPLADTVVCGEPVFCRLRFANTGAEPADVLPFWQWSRGGDARLPPPVAIERRIDDAWEMLPADRWERADMISYERRSYSGVRLEPGQSFVVWWDLRWSHELDEGRYRVQFRIPADGPRRWRSEERLPAPAVEIVVTAPTGRAWELWSAPNRSRGPRGSWQWVTEPEPEYWAGTPYARWCWYYRAERLLCQDMPALHPPQERFWRSAQRAMEQAPRDRLPGPIERVELAARLLAPTYEAGLDEVERVTADLLPELARLADLEWADTIARALAHGVNGARVVRHGGYTGVGVSGVLDEWRWPPLTADGARLVGGED